MPLQASLNHPGGVSLAKGWQRRVWSERHAPWIVADYPPAICGRITILSALGSNDRISSPVLPSLFSL